MPILTLSFTILLDSRGTFYAHTSIHTHIVKNIQTKKPICIVKIEQIMYCCYATHTFLGNFLYRFILQILYQPYFRSEFLNNFKII